MQDPVEFAQRWLGAKPWVKQRQILRALRNNRQIEVRSCNTSGKTHTAAIALAFTTPHELELKMWIGTPERTEHLLQLRRQTHRNQWQ